mmetsp:Transcript_45411/g.106203  ORF Transcript_45411/g.106203 Transcript_45411/m.106203 type:complete len:406 (-) Transcript_45411:201-1418(-)
MSKMRASSAITKFARGASTMARAAPMPCVLRGVVFDMDGTLTTPALDFGRMYERCGVAMSEDLLQVIAAMPTDQAGAAKAVVEEMEAEGRRTLQLCSGAVELAMWLSERGVRTALVTRNSATTVRHLQDALWVPASLPPLDPAYSRDAEHAPKPDPASMHAISQLWDIPVRDILMVGDSPQNDVLYGKAAGSRTALVDSGRKFVEGGSDCGADIVVSSLAELPALLERSFRTRLVGLPFERFEKSPKPEPAEGVFSAAARGDVNALRALSPDALLSTDAFGNTPLIWAANEGQQDAVRFLLESKADVDVSGYLGATALSRAARSGHAGVVQLLLEKKACPEIPNDRWQYPLHFAAYKKQASAVELLLAHGASTTVTDRKGRTPAEDTSDAQIRNAILVERLRRKF